MRDSVLALRAPRKEFEKNRATSSRTENAARRRTTGATQSASSSSSCEAAVSSSAKSRPAARTLRPCLPPAIRGEGAWGEDNVRRGERKP